MYFLRARTLCYKIIVHLSHSGEFSSVQSLSRVWLFVTPWTAAHQASLSITNSWSSPNSCPSSWWCHPAIPSSVVPFSSCPQFLPASESFPMSQLFTWGGQSTGISALASVLPKDTQDWSPLERTGLITISKIQLTNNQFISTFSHYLYNVLRNWIIFCVCVQDPIKNHISHFIVFSFHSSLI